MKADARSTDSIAFYHSTAKHMSTTNILRRIIETKRKEIAASKGVVSPERLAEMADAVARQTVSMSRSLSDKSPAIIAEFKRRSPSKGEIHPMTMADDIVAGYESAGAAACSILTDTQFFGGSLTDLCVARNAVSLPLLRKDFIIDEYQIDQARLCGADAILLIASALTRDEISRLVDYAHRRQLEVLLELHSPDELAKYVAEADMVGVNNRNLSTFATDIDASLSIASSLPANAVKVAESGIKTGVDIRRLSNEGYSAFLIGETLMKSDSPALALKTLINDTH